MYLIDKAAAYSNEIRYVGCAVGMTVVGFVLYTGTEGYAALFALCLYVVYATSWGWRVGP